MDVKFAEDDFGMKVLVPKSSEILKKNFGMARKTTLRF